jgi:hypothetical protein
MQRLAARLCGLGSKLGPVLLQLPPNLFLDTAAPEATLMAFNDDERACASRDAVRFC